MQLERDLPCFCVLLRGRRRPYSRCYRCDLSSARYNDHKRRHGLHQTGWSRNLPSTSQSTGTLQRNRIQALTMGCPAVEWTVLPIHVGGSNVVGLLPLRSGRGLWPLMQEQQAIRWRPLFQSGSRCLARRLALLSVRARAACAVGSLLYSRTASIRNDKVHASQHDWRIALTVKQCWRETDPAHPLGFASLRIRQLFQCSRSGMSPGHRIGHH